MLFRSSAGSPDSVRLLGRGKEALPAGTQVVYYSPNAQVAQVALAQSRAVVPGIFCVQTPEATQFLQERLAVRHLPFVYVVNREGKLAGFGPLDALGSVVAAAQSTVLTNP